MLDIDRCSDNVIMSVLIRIAQSTIIVANMHTVL